MDKEVEGQKTKALLSWAAQIGISDAPTMRSASVCSSSCLGHSLVISHFPDAGGRGFAASRDLRKGELVLRVPRAALLTSEMVLQDGKLASCIEKNHLLSSSHMLTICLLAEVGKGRDSWWYPYLALLPLNYDTLANFQDFEIHALQVEDAIWASKKAILKAKSDWKECLLILQQMKLKPHLLSFRSWLWASATITSRSLHIPWDEAGCLCPIGDLFNYAAPDYEPCGDDSHECSNEEQLNEKADCHSHRLTDGGFEKDSSYCFYAKKNYKKGEQVLLSYGAYTNLDLLEHYGFLLTSNPNEKAFIHLDTEVSISRAWPKESLHIQPDGKPSFALLCTLRLSATPKKFRRAVGHQAHAGSMISTENELVVMKKLANHCCKVLEELPTTIEQDFSLLIFINKMLESSSCLDCFELESCKEQFHEFLQVNGLHKERIEKSSLTVKTVKSLERWRLAVNWRLSYKNILFNCISYCNMVITELS
ncbi:Protein SET domain group 40 [Apostasia shenzhenica]|uniref:Protein SET domain group 40 n=1 Tax=Apostasia shenzhenica TaxID=1088818 RepID=A0A2H9ZXV5_9ASPA|nr:Protein SET domain group 40 [Apostasia shenzhenica]